MYWLLQTSTSLPTSDQVKVPFVATAYVRMRLYNILYNPYDGLLNSGFSCTAGSFFWFLARPSYEHIIILDISQF